MGLLSTTTPQSGDVCTIELDLQANDCFVPEPLFDATGRVSFVVDHGHYLPALHRLVRSTTTSSTSRMECDIDAGYGAYRTDLLVPVPRHKLKALLTDRSARIAVGATLDLRGGPQVVVHKVPDDDKDMVVLDLNSPLAGSSYHCRWRLVAVEPSPWSTATPTSSHFQQATLALGCYWGAELYCMRIPGVVGTRVGTVAGRTEAVQVVWDTRVLSFRELVERAVARSRELRESVLVGGEWLWNTTESSDEDSATEPTRDDDKYRHVVWYQDVEQLQVARQVMGESNVGRMEIRPLSTFEPAGEDQQQYLYKAGQSARKGCKEPIRCFG